MAASRMGGISIGRVARSHRVPARTLIGHRSRSCMASGSSMLPYKHTLRRACFMPQLKYQTRSGVAVTRVASKSPFKRGLTSLLRDLDRYRGIYLSSGYEYPGRYSRWDIASIAPPIEIVSFGRHIEFRPLNERGEVINRI